MNKTNENNAKYKQTNEMREHTPETRRGKQPTVICKFFERLANGKRSARARLIRELPDARRRSHNPKLSAPIAEKLRKPKHSDAG
jgi:hypothetical protein